MSNKSSKITSQLQLIAFYFQGPGKFGEKDQLALHIHSHKYFFARKFDMNIGDKARRKAVTDVLQNNYKEMMAPFITHNVLK